MKKILLVVLCVYSLFSCGTPDQKIEGVKVAEYEGKVLWESDVRDIFSSDIPREDSLHLLNTFVNNWARKQLLAKMAEHQLSNEQKNVSQELEDYRLSLLIYRYEKAYTEQQLNTEVSDEEIENFYKTYPDNFIATTPLVKALYIKVKKDLSALKQIKRVYRLKDSKSTAELVKLCENTAERFWDFNEVWIDLTRLIKELPEGKYDAALAQKRIETEDEKFAYLVHFYEIIMPGSPSPLEYEKDNIHSIILNKRRQEIIKTLENSIYNEAMDHNKIKIYVEKK